MTWAIAIHGGAGEISRTLDVKPYADGLAKALQAAESVVCDGICARPGEMSALNAAVAAVKALELEPLFSAGIGSVLTLDGRAELEASIADGASRRTRAVCGLTTVKHPIVLAYHVLQDSHFQFLGFTEPKTLQIVIRPWEDA